MVAAAAAKCAAGLFAGLSLHGGSPLISPVHFSGADHHHLALHAPQLVLPASAADVDTTAPAALDASSVIASGKVELGIGAAAPPPRTGSVLFVTAQLKTVRGTASVVGAAKFPEPTLPMQYALRLGDLTPAGQEFIQSETAPPADLSISARWDVDGDVNTRSPEDLVGRVTLKQFAPLRVRTGGKATPNTDANIALGGRGAFGRFVTADRSGGP